MDISTFVSVLESVRDKVGLAIHDARRGDLHSSREQIEKAGSELQDAAEELRP